MGISYDVFAGAFLAKVTEFELSALISEAHQDDAQNTVDGYMKRAISSFNKICKYNLLSVTNDIERKFDIDIDSIALEEIIDIVSEGMVVQWLKPYVYQQELLENVLNTRDFSSYSPAELLMRVGNAYKQAQKDYTQMIREYSYNNGNLADLHL